MEIPVLAGDENLGGLDETNGETRVMDSLDRVGDLNDIRPDCALGNAVGLCLQTTVLELGCLWLHVHLI